MNPLLHFISLTWQSSELLMLIASILGWPLCQLVCMINKGTQHHSLPSHLGTKMLPLPLPCGILRGIKCNSLKVKGTVIPRTQGDDSSPNLFLKCSTSQIMKPGVVWMQGDITPDDPHSHCHFYVQGKPRFPERRNSIG